MNLFRVDFSNGKALAGQDYQENRAGSCILRALNSCDGAALHAVELGDLTRSPEETMAALLNVLGDGRPVCGVADEDDEYGDECVLQAAGGKQLRFPSAGRLAEYIRVCDADGEEIVYWVCDEWQDAPDEVIGALLGALA